MSWRRYDDGYEDHPKIVELVALAGYEAYYRLGKIHGYAARFPSKGIVKGVVMKTLGVTPRMLVVMVQVGLLHEQNGAYEIHDWKVYNPDDSTASERMRRYRERNSHRNANVTENVTSRNPAVTETIPHARASASTVPSRPEVQEQAGKALTRPPWADATSTLPPGMPALPDLKEL